MEPLDSDDFTLIQPKRPRREGGTELPLEKEEATAGAEDATTGASSGQERSFVYYVLDRRGRPLTSGFLSKRPVEFQSLQEARDRCEIGGNVIRATHPDGTPNAMWVKRSDGKLRKDKFGFETIWTRTMRG